MWFTNANKFNALKIALMLKLYVLVLKYTKKRRKNHVKNIVCHLEVYAYKSDIENIYKYMWLFVFIHNI